jgi:hypothetical protein
MHLIRACLLVATTAGLPAVVAAQTPPPATSSAAAARAPGSVAGIVVDSVNKRFLRGAIVQVVGSGREGLTGPIGDYRIDSVPPGRYRLRVLHPMLDTLGIALMTPEISIEADGLMSMDIGVPPPERLITVFCTPAQLLRGPAAVVGFVRDPDTEAPLDSARVTLLYEIVRDPLGMMKDSFTREARPDAAGRYKICGVPADMEGKLQVDRKGVKTGEVPVTVDNGVLAIRGLALSLSNRVIAITDDTGGTRKAIIGNARVSGVVLNKRGEPVDGARVSVPGTPSVAVTNSRGEFALDSLPSGSHAIEARKVSYGVTERAVDLAVATPARVTITMNDYVPTLATVTSTARREEDLEAIGFTRRKRSTGGYHFEGKQLNTNGIKFSDAMRGLPGIQVVRTGNNGLQQMITDARDPSGCVSFYVDGTRWKSMVPGDIDDYVRPQELQAVEIYHSSTVPGEFMDAGMSKCMTIVVWTQRRIRG